jgi:site-specific recombinase XerC
VRSATRLCWLAARVGEITSLRLQNLCLEPPGHVRLTGKGDKTRQVTLPDAYLDYLKRWREHLNLMSPLPVPGESSPILPSKKGDAIGKRQVQRIYEQALVATADRMEQEGFHDEAKQMLAIRSETHYLRHTGASQAIEAGGDIRHISEELGHANATFTESVYVNSEQVRRRSAGRRRLI